MFCKASSQKKVNASKTRVFFSQNVKHNKKSQICEELSFEVTTDIVRYLGVPLFHKTITTSNFRCIVDKVKKKLRS